MRKLWRKASSHERQGQVVRAIKEYGQAARSGDRIAATRLEAIKHGEELWLRGTMFEEEGKIAKAVQYYERAARVGNLSGMLNLANLLDDTVSPRKPKEAVYWYKRGVKLGDHTAALNLATHYRNLGNRRWYTYWLSVAAKMGDPEAKSTIRARTINSGRCA